MIKISIGPFIAFQPCHSHIQKPKTRLISHESTIGVSRFGLLASFGVFMAWIPPKGRYYTSRPSHLNEAVCVFSYCTWSAFCYSRDDQRSDVSRNSVGLLSLTILSYDSELHYCHRQVYLLTVH
jgi:hypothetical protein